MHQDGLAQGDRDNRGREQVGSVVAAALARGGTEQPDPSRGNRVRALLCTEPLHELQTNRGRRGPLFAQLDCYDVALATIDFVVDHMGFDSGAEPQAVLDFIAAQITRLAPDADTSAVAEAAVVINETLVRPQRGSYQDADDPHRRPFDFQLLREEPATDGVRVAATNEAINVLVGALDTDVASAHSAADAKVASLVNRKRFSEAELAAREARIRSIQYTAEVRRIIADTRLDVRRAGWGEHVPDRLNEILEVLAERTNAEGRMLDAMRNHRDSAETPTLAATAARLVKMVEDCFDRHRELHNRVMEATETFFAEQERQGFRSELSLRAIDPYEQLLTPIFASSIASAYDAIECFASLSWGVGTRRVVSLDQLLESLLADPREISPLAGELPDEELDSIDDPRRFSQDAWDALAETLDTVDAPIRLSELTALLCDHGNHEGAELVVYSAYGALAIDTERLRTGGSVIAAVIDEGPDGASRDGETGDSGPANEGLQADTDGLFVGPDLLVGRLQPDLEALADVR